MRKFLTFLAILGMLMEVAAIIMAWPLCHGWHPELVWPFLICFVGGFVIVLLLMCTKEYWQVVLGAGEEDSWKDWED